MVRLTRPNDQDPAKAVGDAFGNVVGNVIDSRVPGFGGVFKPKPPPPAKVVVYHTYTGQLVKESDGTCAWLVGNKRVVVSAVKSPN
jgi:hypothetical protein